jgi:hypothetical protein
MSTGADETYVTRHTTRGRLDKLYLKFGDDLDKVLLKWCRDERSKAQYLDALCLNWFGAIGPRCPRSDRGRFHQLPERVWSLACQHCGRDFDASRWDARFCRNACRQAGYRIRKDRGTAGVA